MEHQDKIKISCIYAHINKINGMIYVGQTKDYYKRMKHYKHRYKNQTKLYNATNFYGWDKFIFGEILEFCPPEKLNEREKYWIRHLNTFDISNQNMGYNLTEGGDGGPKGPFSDIHKENLSKAHKGQTSGNKGKKLTNEQRQKLSTALKGCKKGSPSEQHRKNLSLSKMGKKQPNVSLAKKGKKFTEEHKRKLSIAAKQRNKK